MTPLTLAALADQAMALTDDEIHVWQLPYARPMGRQPLRRVLACYLDTDADALALVNGEHGRPELGPQQAGSLGFNWTHSHDTALLAVARNVQPGIDLERLRTRANALEIARRYFHPTEYEYLAMLPDDERDAVFLAIWTAKEAVLKALGRGLAFGLDRLQIDAGPQGCRALRYLHDEAVADWQLQPLQPGSGWIGALAWRGGPRRIRFGRLASLA